MFLFNDFSLLKHMYNFLTESFVALLVIINPFAVVPVFSSLTAESSLIQKRYVARRSCIISILLLLLFAFIGDFLLKTLHITEAAFRITGGFLLLLTAIDMVRFDMTDKNDASCRAGQDISVFPIAIPFLAGPGAITSTVILMRQATTISMSAQVGFLILLLVMMLLTYVCLIVSDRIMRVVGVTGTNVLTRVFGIVLTALSLQSIINGIFLVLHS